MKVLLRDQVKDLTVILRDLIRDSTCNFSSGVLVSFFNEVDTRQRTILEDPLVSFFNEVDTRQRTILRDPWFHFLTRLTQVNELSSEIGFMFLHFRWSCQFFSRKTSVLLND